MRRQTGIANWLRLRCRNEKLASREAGAKVGVSHSAISNIMKGTQPTMRTITKLANTFGGDGTAEKVALQTHLIALAGYRPEDPVPGDWTGIIPMLSARNQRTIKVLVKELARAEGVSGRFFKASK